MSCFILFIARQLGSLSHVTK